MRALQPNSCRDMGIAIRYHQEWYETNSNVSASHTLCRLYQPSETRTNDMDIAGNTCWNKTKRQNKRHKRGRDQTPQKHKEEKQSEITLRECQPHSSKVSLSFPRTLRDTKVNSKSVGKCRMESPFTGNTTLEGDRKCTLSTNNKAHLVHTAHCHTVKGQNGIRIRAPITLKVSGYSKKRTESNANCKEKMG